MASKRRFYRTLIVYEVLSEEPLGSVSLEQIANETREGDMSGQFKPSDELEVDGLTMAKLLQAQGSDPAFFQLTADGEDTEDSYGEET